MSRISDAISLFLMRTFQRIAELSPMGKIILAIIFILLGCWGVHLGLLPHDRRNPVW
jgi:hypothetical protein